MYVSVYHCTTHIAEYYIGRLQKCEIYIIIFNIFEILNMIYLLLL